MKILWFCNTPANAIGFFNCELKGSGGWLMSLDQLLQDQLQLHVAFYFQYDKSFKYKNTTYHPIKTNTNIFNRVKNRLFSYVPGDKDLSKYLEIINRVKPDIIHIHGTENSFAILISHTNIPVILSIQGLITAISQKYCAGFEKNYLHVTQRKLTSLKDILYPWSFNVEYKLFQKLDKLEIKNLKAAKNIMGRTDWDNRITRILAPNSNYYHEDRILRSSFYQHQWLPHHTNKIIIHTTNDNSFYKGFETLCLAIIELDKIKINFEWRVAGIKPDDLIVKITKQKLKNKYPKKELVLLGIVNEIELVQNLLIADIFVMTSHIENNVNSLCEAMILGMPCISTFVGGVGSLIKDGEEGILIQDGDPWAMAGSILELANNKEKAIRLGSNARKVAHKRHDKDRICDELITNYQKILTD